MKKNRKFVTFPIIRLKNLVSIPAIAIILIAAIFSASFFIKNTPNSEFVKLTMHIATKTTYTPPKINLARAMLTISAPTISFRQIKEENPSVTTAPTPQAPTQPPTAPIENNAQSITYKSAEEKGYKSIDGIYINNQTSKQINIEQLLNKPLDINLTDAPAVLIIHTHTTESYTPSEKYNYTPSETDRTTDLNYNMVSVGEVIYNHLTENGINTIHDKTINDHPSYSQSYSKSLKLVQGYMQKYPSIKIVIDVHRDAIVTKSGTKMRPVASFDTPCAQVMTVVGTNDSGLNHPQWQTNLAFVLKLQHEMNTLYPSLARPINLRRERFNHHLAPYAFILEVGTNGNTLDEAKEGALLFSKSLVSLLKV